MRSATLAVLLSTRALCAFDMRTGLALRATLALLLAFVASASLAQESIPSLSAGSPGHGAELIAQKGCGACHTIPGIAGADGLVGPPLTLMGKRVFVAGLLRNTPQNLAAWVLEPQRFVPGNAMPSTGLTESEALGVAAYLETIR
jgi:cytochrome c2